MLFNSIYKILMATRIKDWIIPYTWGVGIEITEDHVINVLLRAMNNLIMVNEDRELYVDLQLEDWIEPDADFPVWVTTGRILEEDWRPQNATILNWKTTSWDYVRLIYAADDNLYYDPWTWEWRLLATRAMVEEALTDSNTKTFWIEDNQDFTNAQAAYDWYIDGKSPLIIHEWLFWLQMLTLAADQTLWTTHTLIFAWGEDVASWPTMTTVSAPTVQFQAEDWEVQDIFIQDWRSFSFLDPNATSMIYTNPFTPTIDWHPATKKYVDDWLALKQDILTAWTNITIDQNNVISATIPAALVYKGNVQTVNDLPSSWQAVWDTYFVEWVDWMYSRDWTQWNYVWSTSPSLTNYFNMTINDSDDITEWSIHLFCTTSEKSTWNAKQDALTAWANIQISNNVISAIDTTYSAWTWIWITWTTINNTKPFDPENTGSLSQVLKKTSTWYRRANEVEWFDPENAGTTGQVLKKTNDWYAWANESWWWGWTSYTAWDWISISNHVITNTKPFDPSSWGTAGQVLTKTADWYEWSSTSVEQEVRVWEIPQWWLSQEDMQTITQRCLNEHHSAILKYSAGSAKDCFVYWWHSTLNSVAHFYFLGTWINRSITTTANGDYTTLYHTAYHITFDGTTYTQEYMDYDIAGNYLTAAWLEQSDPTPFIPQYWWQPTSKKYVDDVNWTWTLSEYNALVNQGQIDPNKVYNITSLS